MKPQAAMAAPSRIRTDALATWLRASLPEAQGELRIERISGGDEGFHICANGRSLLLRMQGPRGNLLPMASPDREYRILQALATAGIPVPRAVLYCGDADVLGAPFWLVEKPEGRVFSDYALTDLPAAQRRAVFFAMAEAMAKLHRLDWAAAGLADCGRPAHFYARETAHWTRQWEMRKAAGRADGNREMDRVAAWLVSRVPDDDEAAIIHGDFRLGKLVFHPNEARVVTVLGWEQWTLGHPLADVAHCCLPWQLATRKFGGIRGLDLAEEGIPTQAEYLIHYRQCGGYAESLKTFHLVFSLFRSAMAEFEGGNAGSAAMLARRAAELIDGADR
jgi:aminoglycoside phosphotransferase (APT) family kinase protein